MRGIVRPCRHRLGPELAGRWRAHLCGLCLTLRDVAGQPQRVLTGYDVLLLSVLVEAQTGAVATRDAGPCALRGFTRATVVDSGSGAGRLAAAGALLSGGAGLADKADDGDVPRPLRAPARGAARRVAAMGAAVAAEVGLDPSPVLDAPARAGDVESRASASLDDLLAPAGDAVGALFAHTAVVAGRSENVPALADAGRAFGRLVHLLDAVEDRADDAAAGRFNPLTATGTDALTARGLADRLVADVRGGMARVRLVDRSLVDVLLGREVEHAVHRALPVEVPVPAQRSAGAVTVLLALWAVLLQGVFVGGSWGGGRRRPRRPRRYPPGSGPGWGHRRPHPGADDWGYPVQRRTRVVGPSCGQLLACNCCANVCCNACCCAANQ
ncbi:MAG: DUF5685 family protein [Actinomycetes bacterium]